MSSSGLVISGDDRATLESCLRSSTLAAGLVERARIVLCVAGGAGTSATARQVGVSRPTVIKWRDRFAARGLAGLDDEPPAALGVTHWSSRLLAAHLGIGDATVARAWRRYRVQPWQAQTFKFSTDPELEAKVHDVVGLYLAPPRNAVVLCVDEKSRAPRGADEAVREEGPAAGHRSDRLKLEAGRAPGQG